jgi:nucleoside-diphosphate-sugar epimerase
MSKQPVILITGASGFIGSRLVEHFHRKGWTVIAAMRGTPSQFGDGVLYYHWDLAGIPQPDMLSGVDYLVHCAYMKYDSSSESDKINIEGTRNLLDLARKSGVRRNIFLSSMSAGADALSHYGKQKFMIEKFFSSKADTVIRPGLVLGNGGLFSEMSKFIREKRIVPLIDGGRQPLQTVYIDDLVAAVDSALEKELPGTFTVAETLPVPYREFYRALAEMLKVKAKLIPVPSWLVSAGISVLGGLGMKIPVSKENLRGLKNLKFSDSSSDLMKLGIKVRTWKESLLTLSGDQA